MPNKPLCHPMTVNKITPGGRVGRRNETVRHKFQSGTLEVKTDSN